VIVRLLVWCFGQPGRARAALRGPRCAADVRPWLAGLLLKLSMLLALLVPALPAHAAPETVTTADNGEVRIGGAVEYLIEQPGQPLDWQQANALDARWTLYEGRRFHLPTQSTAVWIRFDVRNLSNSNTWLLGVDWPLLEEVHFYQYDPLTRRVVASYSDGIGIAPEDRSGRQTAYAFPLPLERNDVATVLLRVRTHTSFVVPLTLWSPEPLLAERQKHNLLMGVMFGVLAVMLLYNAALFVFTRDRSYAYYSAYLCAAVLYELALTGYGPLYFWGASRWLSLRGYETFAALTFLTATLFFRKFLDLKKCGVRHVKWINTVLVVFWTVVFALNFVMQTEWLSMVSRMFGVLSAGTAVYSSVYLMVRGNVSARYFAIAWLALVIGTFGHILSRLGVISSNAFTDNGQHAGFLIETVLLSIALADRIRRERRARKRAQRKALELAGAMYEERDQKIRAQEESIAIQLRANEELELRVLDRTGELERAMKNLEIANIELAKLSVTDALTKVHNRRYFDEALKREHDRSARSGLPLALVLADIDHFKRINDGFGHLAGDECLRLVAAALTATVGRSTDLVARFGGEEFALVLPATLPEQAAELAERVRQAVADISFIYRGTRVPMTISLGVVARIALPTGSVADFIAEADAAMYRAKAAGRDRVELAA
jgi:diguanylate cyclase (GGDEF)-like protein